MWSRILFSTAFPIDPPRSLEQPETELGPRQLAPAQERRIGGLPQVLGEFAPGVGQTPWL